MFVPLRGNFMRSLDVDLTRGYHRSGRGGAASTEDTSSALLGFTRATTATDFDAYGQLTSAASGVLRNGYAADPIWRPERATGNVIRNITMSGGGAGVAPTNWSFGTLLGVTGTVQSVGVENGLTYVEVRWVGTGSSSGGGRIYADNHASITSPAAFAASVGQTWTSAWHFKLVANPGVNLPIFSVEVMEKTGAVGAAQTGVVFVPTSTWQRAQHTRTLSISNVDAVTSPVRFGITNGVTYDFTMRYALPTLERTTVATEVGPWRTEAADNKIRNPTGMYTTGQPAFPSTSFPTNWLIIGTPTVGTQTWTITGQGIEAGMPYFDLRIFGTPNNTSDAVLAFEPTLGGNALVSVGQTWTNSFYVKTVSGTAPQNVRCTISEISAGGATVQATNGAFTSPGATWQRLSVTKTITLDTAYTARPGVRIAWTTGVGYDYTLRIALPVLEQTAAATDITPLTHGWLIEGAATNLCLNSGFIGGAGAGYTTLASPAGGGTSTNTSEVTAPDGTSTATKYTTNSAGQDVVFQVIGCAASTQYTWSFYLRLGTLAAANYKFAVYNETGAAMIASDIAPAVTPTANGWTRVTYTFTTPVGCVQVRPYIYRNSLAENSTFYVWGAQLETGGFATSYVPTTASTATRNNDQLNITGTNFTDLFPAPSRTNLALRSGELENNGPWIRSQLTGVTANAQTDPFGGTTAETMTDDTNNAPHGIQQVVTFNAGQQYTASIYAKAGTKSILRLTFNDQVGNQAHGWFNLSNSTATTSNSGTTALPTTAMVSVGSGWYRCSVTCVPSTATIANGIIAYRMESTAGSLSYLGDATGTLHVFGAQMETGSTATPYIPTTTTAVTSNAPTQGTIIIDALLPQASVGAAQYLCEIDDGSESNRIVLFNLLNNTQMQSLVSVAGINSTFVGSRLMSAGTAFRFGMRWTATALANSFNGQAVDSITLVMPSGLSVLRLGNSATFSRPMNGRIRRVQVFPYAMSDAELMARTTLGAG